MENIETSRKNRTDATRILETGIRVALEEMLTGRDYARVEDILRALAEESSVPATPVHPSNGYREAEGQLDEMGS